MFKRICSFLSTIILIVLAIIAALLIVPKFLGYSQYAVLSGSMEPNIHVGAIVYDKEVDADSLEVGDVVTYQLGSDTLVTHRITEIDTANQTVTTQGDANDTADASPVSYENIKGVCAFSIPVLGYLSIYGKTPIGIAAICGILIILILLNFLPEIFAKEEKQEKE